MKDKWEIYFNFKFIKFISSKLTIGCHGNKKSAI